MNEKELRLQLRNALRLLREYRFEHDELVQARTHGKGDRCLCERCYRVGFILDEAGA